MGPRFWSLSAVSVFGVPWDVSAFSVRLWLGCCCCNGILALSQTGGGMGDCGISPVINPVHRTLLISLSRVPENQAVGLLIIGLLTNATAIAFHAALVLTSVAVRVAEAPIAD